MLELYRITRPTLIVGGDNDELVPPHLLDATSRAIPSSRLLVFPDAGHSVQMERTRAYGEAVSDFLEQDRGRDAVTQQQCP